MDIWLLILWWKPMQHRFAAFWKARHMQLLCGVIRIDMMTVRVYQVQHRAWGNNTCCIA